MIISLAEKQLEQNKELIAGLEQLLAEAREGKIIDLVAAYTSTDGEFSTYLHYDRPLTAMGLSAALHTDVVNSAIEQQE